MNATGLRRLGLASVAVIAALALLIACAGANPLAALAALVRGAVGDTYVLSETLVTATPLAIVALGVAPALRSGIFSIGSQGQLVMGAAVATAAVVHAAPGTSSAVLLVEGCLAGMAAGAAYALIPAILRAYLHVNEILSTLLLNYIASFALQWALKHPLKASVYTATPRSDPLPDGALIANLVSGTRLHVAVFAVILLAGVVWYWTGTRSGLLHALFAERPKLAARLGLAAPRAIVTTMLFSGAAAGFAGWVQVAGVTHTLYPSVDGGLGFSGILVAVLGGLHPIGILLAALLFGALTTGVQGMQIGTSVPAAIAIVVQGFVLFAAALSLARPSSPPTVPPAPQTPEVTA